jgi:hypothetical protein
MQRQPLPTGYYRYRLIVNVDGNPCIFQVVAKSPSQAWQKYVAQYFRNCPLKPNKTDYKIEKETK